MQYKSAMRMILLLLLVANVGCAKDFEELDSKTLKQKFEESDHDSASGWWYLGPKDNYYYLVLKYPTRRYYYKINKRYIEINLINPKDLTVNEFKWTNIKTKDIKFLQ